MRRRNAICVFYLRAQKKVNGVTCLLQLQYIIHDYEDESESDSSPQPDDDESLNRDAQVSASFLLWDDTESWSISSLDSNISLNIVL